MARTGNVEIGGKYEENCTSQVNILRLIAQEDNILILLSIGNSTFYESFNWLQRSSNTGLYKCIAENTVGKAQKQIKIKVFCKCTVMFRL